MGFAGDCVPSGQSQNRKFSRARFTLQSRIQHGLPIVRAGCVLQNGKRQGVATYAVGNRSPDDGCADQDWKLVCLPPADHPKSVGITATNFQRTHLYLRVEASAS
jgi:hypothetical protein